MSLESSFIKVPFEQLKKANRTSQKHIEKEMTNLASTISDIASKTAAKKIKPDDAIKTIDSAVERLNKLKRKLDEIRSEELTYSNRTRARLDHLNQITHLKFCDSDEYIRWSKIRLDRLLIDYMMRTGFIDTAEKMAQDEGLKDFVDVEFFRQARKIENALESNNCSECLAWCNDNKTALRKMKSTLEFNLRLQEFIELARKRDLNAAIAYAKKHFSGWIDSHMKEIQQAMALLAFPEGTACRPYKNLYEPSRWTYLITQFRSTLFSLHSLPLHPSLSLALQAGLSALKTSSCTSNPDSTSRNINCPICSSSDFEKLAEKLPRGHHVNSCYVCKLTGEIMNEDNPPMVLPNGSVFSLKALTAQSAKNNGKIKCQRTGAVYSFNQLKKMFIT